MHVTSPDTTDPLVHRLHEIADQAPYLARIARLYSAILPLLREADPGDVSAFMSQDAVREKLAQGQYLLQDLDREIDFPAVAGLLLRLAAAAEKAGENVNTAKLQAWIEEHEGNAGMILQDVLEGKGRMHAQVAEQLGMDAGIFQALVQNALKPDLRAWGRQLAPLAADMKWDRGSCFVCGSEPVLAELQGNNQDKHLRCGVCGADWRVQRLSCPRCGNEDHRSLKTFIEDDDPRKARIESCERCMTYLKVIPAFSPTPVDMLPVEDLATIHLDAIAREQGYRRIGDAA
jgi:FdhE protein